MPNPILVWGTQSQAYIVTRMIEGLGKKVDFYFDPTGAKPTFNTKAIITHDFDFFTQETKFDFSIAIGAEHGKVRHDIFDWLKKQGHKSLDLISPHVTLSSDVVLNAHSQIFSNATLHFGVQVGDCCVINTSATVDHECLIGNGVHIMGSVAIAGRVIVGDYATIGTNATILPEITIGTGAFIGAGAVVIEDVPDFTVVAGVPAKPLRQNTLKNAFLPK